MRGEGVHDSDTAFRRRAGRSLQLVDDNKTDTTVLPARQRMRVVKYSAESKFLQKFDISLFSLSKLNCATHYQVNQNRTHQIENFHYMLFDEHNHP